MSTDAVLLQQNKDSIFKSISQSGDKLDLLTGNTENMDAVLKSRASFSVLAVLLA